MAIISTQAKIIAADLDFDGLNSQVIDFIELSIFARHNIRDFRAGGSSVQGIGHIRESQAQGLVDQFGLDGPRRRNRVAFRFADVFED